MMSGPACRCHHPLCPDCRGRVLAREALVRDAVRRVLADGFPMTPIYRVNRVADAVLSVPVVRDALARDAQVREIVAATAAEIRNPQPGSPPGAYIFAEGMDDVFDLYAPSPGVRVDSGEQ